MKKSNNALAMAKAIDKLKKVIPPVQKEDAMTTADAGIPQDTKDMGPRLPTSILRRRMGKEIPMTDRRRKQNKPPKLLKRFSKYVSESYD
tara:strand:- start:74 stop:343 length:270 start_codon:yes stop_codon:yes gene_type:complete